VDVSLFHVAFPVEDAEVVCPHKSSPHDDDDCCWCMGLSVVGVDDDVESPQDDSAGFCVVGVDDVVPHESPQEDSAVFCVVGVDAVPQESPQEDSVGSCDIEDFREPCSIVFASENPSFLPVGLRAIYM